MYGLVKKIGLISLLATSVLAKDVYFENTDESSNDTTDIFVEVGGAYTNTNDSFQTTKDANKKYADDDKSFQPMLNFNLVHHLSSKWDLEFGSEFQTVNTALNYHGKDFNLKGGLEASLFEDEQWANPFDTQSNGSKTDVTSNSMFIDYEKNISEMYDFTLSYKITHSKYDNDMLQDSLKRTGNTHRFIWSNQIKNFIIDVNYEINDAQGDASSYDKYALLLGTILSPFNKTDISFKIGYGQTKYDAINPILNKTIESDDITFLVEYKYTEPFSYKNTYVKVLYSYEDSNANDTFYDKRYQMAGIAVGYKF